MIIKLFEVLSPIGPSIKVSLQAWRHFNPDNQAALRRWSYHGTIIRTGIICKKSSSNICDSVCRWLVVENVKNIKHF